MGVLKNSQQNNSETVTNDHYKEILKEKYLSLQERQEIIYELRLKQYNDGVSKKKQEFQKIHIKIIQRKLQMRVIKKCQKKNIFLWKKDRNLLIILVLI